MSNVVRGEDPLASNGCDVWLATTSDDDVPNIDVRIVNDTGGPILIPAATFGCFQSPRYFRVEGTAGGRALQSAEDNCASAWPSCPAWWGLDPACLLCSTEFPRVCLPNGGVFTETWPALAIFEGSLPRACLSADGPQDVTCFARAAFSPGTYVAQAIAGISPPDAPDCPCLDGGGVCTTEAVAEWSLSAQSEWDGTCSSIEIVFR